MKDEQKYYAVADNYTGQLLTLATKFEEDPAGLVSYTEITKAQYDEAMAEIGGDSILLAEVERLQQQAAAQARALEALRVAVRMVDSKIHQNLLEYAGPGSTLDIPLTFEEIEALRAALRQAEEGGA